MKLIRLIALSSLFIVVTLSFISCEKSSYDKNQPFEFSKSGIALSGGQETPAVPSTATGTMNVSYSRETRLLSYTVSWSGLADSVVLMHIHGLAPAGFATGVVQNIIIPPALCTVPPSPVGTLPNCNDGTVGNGIFPQKTKDHKFTYAKSGTISASLLVDGVRVKEEDLLNGQFYMNIHTSVYPGGEIRGQIIF